MEKRKSQGKEGLAQPIPRPGTRMLDLIPCTSDPMRLAEESIEELKRRQPPRVVKTCRRKRKPRGQSL
jgi:hypothetical protein